MLGINTYEMDTIKQYIDTYCTSDICNSIFFDRWKRDSVLIA